MGINNNKLEMLFIKNSKRGKGFGRKLLIYAIKKCKNCGKFFVPDNRVDELYCNSIYENNKTCKEV